MISLFSCKRKLTKRSAPESGLSCQFLFFFPEIWRTEHEESADYTGRDAGAARGGGLTDELHDLAARLLRAGALLHPREQRREHHLHHLHVPEGGARDSFGGRVWKVWILLREFWTCLVGLRNWVKICDQKVPPKTGMDKIFPRNLEISCRQKSALYKCDYSWCVSSMPMLM